MTRSRSIMQEITGKAANNNYGILSPASLGGTTTLQLYENRLVENTKKLIATRHCEVILTEIDSVEIAEEGISWILVLGIMTLFLYGLGIIFIILYFIMKYKYLIVRSGSNAQVLCIANNANMEKARSFMYAVLAQAEREKRKSHS